MKSVLISIRPEWCEKIASGEKTMEVRKTKPNLDTPFKVYIYCTAGTGKNIFNVPISREQIMKDYIETGSMACLNCPIGNQKVIGEFICDNVVNPFSVSRYWVPSRILNECCLSPDEIRRYANDGKVYAWHISDLKIYDKPKCIGDFKVRKTNTIWSFTKKLERPPQSWCYVEELSDE